ncbi:MAG: glycosyltransferase family 8 protein [Gloeomargaritaceae cyanobacterium C42_A2020_066]|nr:glycosyltransferase family 8 protein [Gloeomargaritaceae cyanobacterium C42_A2020_066]
MTLLTLACGGDDRYAIGVAVTLYSALVNLGPAVEAVHLAILDGGIGPENRLRLERVLQKGAQKAGRPVHIEFLSVDTSAFQVYRARQTYLNAAAYMRLLLPNLLPDATTQVLYLDSDLVIRGDVSQISGPPQEAAAAYAAPDPLFTNLQQSGLPKTCPALALDPQAPYFNSGVMVLDLGLWRQQHLVNRCLSYLEQYGGRLRFADQDVLNAVLAGQWRPLNPVWNTYALQWHDSPDAQVWHFVGPHKPWQIYYPWKPPWQAFAHYLFASSWFTGPEFVQWWLQSLGRMVQQTLAR